MPQKWETNWPLQSSPSNRSEAEELRDEAIKAIGNLTLTSGKLNARLSNGNWNEKRSTLDQHTALFINKNLVADAPDDWNEDAIWNRSRQLAELVVQIWPSGENI